jgi:hypothetical protein
MNLLVIMHVGVLRSKHYMKWTITVVQPLEILVLVKIRIRLNWARERRLWTTDDCKKNSTE